MSESTENAIDKLMRIHYQHFMSRTDFWSDKNAIDADALICVAASNLRRDGAAILTLK